MLFSSPYTHDTISANSNTSRAEKTQNSLPAANAYVGENDTNIANKHIQQHVPLLLLGSLSVQPDAPLHQGVLAHENHTVLTQTLHECQF